jgi:hypothetical protein
VGERFISRWGRNRFREKPDEKGEKMVGEDGLTAFGDPCLPSTSPFSPLSGSFEYFRFSDINAAGDRRLREKSNPKAIARARGGDNPVRKSSARTLHGTKYVGYGDVASGEGGRENTKGIAGDE